MATAQNHYTVSCSNSFTGIESDAVYAANIAMPPLTEEQKRAAEEAHKRWIQDQEEADRQQQELLDSCSLVWLGEWGQFVYDVSKSMCSRYRRIKNWLFGQWGEKHEKV